MSQWPAQQVIGLPISTTYFLTEHQCHSDCPCSPGLLCTLAKVKQLDRCATKDGFFQSCRGLLISTCGPLPIFCLLTAMKTTMICWYSFAIHTGTVAVLCPRNKNMQMLKLSCVQELQRGKGVIVQWPRIYSSSQHFLVCFFETWPR